MKNAHTSVPAAHASPLRACMHCLEQNAEEFVLVLLLVLISVVELLQVIFRNLPGVPALTWAEEFCRFCWIATVFLSLPYSIRKGCMLRVDAFKETLPWKMQRIVCLAADAITALTLLFLSVCSVPVVHGIRLSQETSPAMLWPMWTVYGTMLLGFFGGFLRALQKFLSDFRQGRSEPCRL